MRRRPSVPAIMPHPARHIRAHNRRAVPPDRRELPRKPPPIEVESCLGNVRPQVVRIPAVRQEMLDIPLVAAEGFRRREERMIDADIIPRHARGGEALLETLPHLFSVERYNKR